MPKPNVNGSGEAYQSWNSDPGQPDREHDLAVDPNGGAPAEVGVDDELLDLIELAELHFGSGSDIVFEFLHPDRSPKAKTGGTPARLAMPRQPLPPN